MTEHRIPPSLKWLVTKRARVSASLAQVELRLNTARQTLANRLAEAEAQHREIERIAHAEIGSLQMLREMLQTDLVALDRTIGQHPVVVEPDRIKPKKTYSDRFGRYGQVARILRLSLYRSNGMAVSTDELTRRVAVYTRMPLDGALFAELRDRVARRLRYMLSQDEVIRLHPVSGARSGSWLPGPRLQINNSLALDRYQGHTTGGFDELLDACVPLLED